MKKKILLTSLLIILIGFFTFNFISVKADSGWDSDFDSDWGSDFDSDWGSDWDSDWGSSDYSYHGGSSGNSSIGFFFFVIFIIIIIIYNSNKGHNRGYNPGTTPRKYQGNSDFTQSIDESMIQEYIPGFNKKEFLNKANDVFINVQNAWSEFDYKKLRSLLTDELYNTYHTQLVALKAKKQKNIMSDFETKNIDITNIDVKGDKISLTVALTISFYDYVVDKDDNVTRGTKSYKLTNSYNLTFVSTLNEKEKNKERNCPSCGAKLENASSNVCPYCNSTVVFESHDWLLSKKEIRR
jgi:hypothetical protein